MDNLRGVVAPGEAIFCQKLVAHALGFLGIAQVAN
jgi:hypothetical protein